MSPGRVIAIVVLVLVVVFAVLGRLEPLLALLIGGLAAAEAIG